MANEFVHGDSNEAFNLNDDEIQQFIESNDNKNTSKKTINDIIVVISVAPQLPVNARNNSTERGWFIIRAIFFLCSNYEISHSAVKFINWNYVHGF
jgi:hypothetical protein